jgi:hypothetical protein
MLLPSLTRLLFGALLILCTSPVFSQISPIANLVYTQFEDDPVITTVAPFTILHQKNQQALKVAPNAQFLTLNHAILGEICQNKPHNITLKLPYQGGTLLIDLTRKDITTDDFSIITEHSSTPTPYISGVHYRGIVRGDDRSVVAISFFEDEVMGGINTNNKGKLVLGRLADRGNIDHYILYAANEMTVENPFSCATEAVEATPSIKHETHGGGTPEVTKCVRVFMEADNELFLDKGSSIQSTVNYLLGMFNQTATLYANEQITTIASQIFVWTTPDIYTPTSSATVLNQFLSFRTSFNGDIAHLVGLGGNNLGGIAYVDVLCTSYKAAFSDITTNYSNVPVYSWTVEVFTHEMGHNLGSRHTQWCGWSGGPIDNCVSAEGNCSPGPTPTNGGTIMSYCHLTGIGINFNNGFGPQPGTTIRNSVTNASCVSASCPTATCDAPISLTITNITGNGATIGWGTTNGATGYVLRYRQVGAGAWTTISTPANPYTITGLPANDEIEVTVQSLCGSNSSDYKNGTLFITGASGGSGGGGGTTCDAPSNLSAQPSSASAQTSWNTANGAASYNIQWKVNTSSTWGTAVSVTSNSYNINNLSAATTYNVRVATVCNGATSAFSTTTFTTSGNGGGGVTCNAPANISSTAITTTTAQTSWTAVSGASSYNVQWKTSVSATWNTPVVVTANSYAINGLSAATIYNVRVATVCGSTSSGFTTGTFTTAPLAGCGASPTVTTTPAQTSAVVNWVSSPGANTYTLEWKLATSSTWNNAVTLSTTTYTINNLVASTAYDVRLTSTCANGVSTPTVSLFSTGATSVTCNLPTNFNVTVGTTNAATSWSNMTGASYYWIQWKATNSTTWSSLKTIFSANYNITSLVSGTAYQVRIATVCSAGQSAFTTSTFTTAGTGTSCGAPTNLNAVPSSLSAQTTWTGVLGANSYSIQWKTSSSAVWGTAVSVTAATYNIANLSAATDYNVRVAAVCNGVLSAYITTSFLTTSSGSCGAPVTMTVTPTTVSGLVKWSLVTGASAYQIQWKATSSSTWGALTTVSTNSFDITGLATLTNYNVRVRSICNGNSSAYTNGQFTTIDNGGGTACDPPSTVTANNVQASSVRIDWSTVSGAVSYSIRVRIVGNINWFTFTGLPAPGVTIQNLLSSTTYEVQVAVTCSNSGTSVYSPSTTFTTPALFIEQEDRSDFVKIPKNNGFKASVAPNPFTQNARLVIDNQEDIPAQITILNSFGQVISDQHTTIRGGSTDLDTPTLPNGVYFVRVRIESEVQTVRVVKH